MIATGDSVGTAHLAVEGYSGQLLTLAIDLGTRLLTAFDAYASCSGAVVELW